MGRFAVEILQLVEQQLPFQFGQVPLRTVIFDVVIALDTGLDAGYLRADLGKFTFQAPNLPVDVI